MKNLIKETTVDFIEKVVKPILKLAEYDIEYRLIEIPKITGGEGQPLFT